MKRAPVWVFMHSMLMLSVVINLLSGLRIATLDKVYLMALSPLLPQGNMHQLHLYGASALIALLVAYLVYVMRLQPRRQSPKPQSTTAWYHFVIVHFGYVVLSGLIFSGLSLYFSWFDSRTLHSILAFALVAYIPLHGAIYFIQYGLKALKLISVPNFARLGANMTILMIALITAGASYGYLTGQSEQTVEVGRISLAQGVRLDGLANESQWQSAKEVVVETFGGANFVNGATQVRVKAIENGVEAYFHMSWDDPDKSLKHLPLVKTAQGWQVQEAGFYRFDETQYYEDKFAVILSDNCRMAAAGTAHLGPQPLADKPANFSGKGYHYSENAALVDLWHWKAVRTNTMILADDNFIGAPDVVRAGSRRYTAGYMPDGKETGAYVMNWQWYKPTGIVPKRLPKSAELLKPFQADGEQASQPEDWVIPWFAYQPYKAENDIYPIGTVMPSVMYRSNRFEGDRADVRAFGVWQNGRWSLELSRKLDTGSAHDVKLTDGVCLWVAAFDHAQVAHTRHNRPLKLKFARAL